MITALIIAFWLLVLAAMVLAIVRLYRLMAQEQKPHSLWQFDAVCYLCRKPPIGAGHYVGGGRVCCDDCYGVERGAVA